MSIKDSINIYGARVHNLKNIDLEIPRNKLVVFTGLSGSGKSSLAFNTIHAEGQRRYLETFNAYARQFLGNMERPDVDKITGLSPVVSIEQKTTSKNPRSTVGTITEIYDYIRLLYARVGVAYSYKTDEKMVKYNDKQILQLILEEFEGKNIYILAPIIRARKGHYRELFYQVLKKGFIKVRINGEMIEIIPGLKLDRYKTHDIEIVIDQLKVCAKNNKRILMSLNQALKDGDGVMMILDQQNDLVRYFSNKLMCPSTGIAYKTPEPNSFSFNSPKGACDSCNGIGTIKEVDVHKIIPDISKSINQGAIAPIANKRSDWITKQLEIIGKKYGFNLNTPISEFTKRAKNAILYGEDSTFSINLKNIGVSKTYKLQFNGIISFIKDQASSSYVRSIERWASNYMSKKNCPECNGSRLNQESMSFKVGNMRIHELTALGISNLAEWLSNIDSKLDKNQKAIANYIIKELQKRVQFILDVGLSYLTLDRQSRSLSGGEAQRIRLATQIGAQLTNVLYILDEPSIGLHQKDNQKLIKSLKNLRDIGNSVIVVEHDKDMIKSSDFIVDLGPKAGILGGNVVAKGTLSEIMKNKNLTARYLNHELQIKLPKRRKINDKSLKLFGARGNNLKSVDLIIPLGNFTCVTGVSGSGKSTLVNNTLYPILNKYFFRGVKQPLPYDNIEGIENIDKVIEVDQSPIGRTPRSNPATYTGVFSHIRHLFANLPESRIRGYKVGRYSFNVKGGRCETCEGAGLKTIEMNFLPDILVHCEFCNGKRYNRETLEIRYKGKSIADILNMTINQSVDFFKSIPAIYRKIKTIQDVGLGYITLGQSSTTLSGGEAQRIKLASELSKRNTGKTFYILDEPTTGLHFHDVKVFLDVIQKLVDKGNTVLIIEHNMDVIKVADFIIDLGPEGGEQGGQIIFSGTPEEIIKCNESHTGQYLRKEL